MSLLQLTPKEPYSFEMDRQMADEIIYPVPDSGLEKWQYDSVFPQ